LSLRKIKSPFGAYPPEGAFYFMKTIFAFVDFQIQTFYYRDLISPACPVLNLYFMLIRFIFRIFDASEGFVNYPEIHSSR
jgi:hypothetical protein